MRIKKIAPLKTSQLLVLVMNGKRRDPGKCWFLPRMVGSPLRWMSPGSPAGFCALLLSSLLERELELVTYLY